MDRGELDVDKLFCDPDEVLDGDLEGIIWGTEGKGLAGREPIFLDQYAHGLFYKSGKITSSRWNFDVCFLRLVG